LSNIKYRGQTDSGYSEFIKYIILTTVTICSPCSTELYRRFCEDCLFRWSQDLKVMRSALQEFRDCRFRTTL